jgi:two-component system osmolarity sensor histidine kinase EnvZ
MKNSAPGVRLARKDWMFLIFYLTAGIISSFLILQLLVWLLLEPLMISESSLRIAKNVILVEEVLKRLDPDELPTGLIIERSAGAPAGSSNNLNRFDRHLRDSLIKERGIDRLIARDIPPFRDPLGGHWIRLNKTEKGKSLWIYQPDRLSSSLWFMGPLRAIALILGMMGGVLLFLRSQLILPVAKISASLPNGSNRRTKLIAETGMLPVQSLCVGVNRLLERINANENDRRTLIRGLVHDFSGPTTRLILRVEQLGIDLRGQHGPVLDSILGDLSHLKSLAQQLRLLAETGALENQPEEASLDDLCHRIADRYDRKNVLVNVPRILVFLEVNSLERAISNLLDNALEYGRPPVQLTAEQRRNGLLICVDDHGEGIASPTSLTMPHQSRCNDRERRRHQGLGLAIVDAFCVQHDGELLLSRSPLGGLRAELVLPPSVLLR